MVRYLLDVKVFVVANCELRLAIHFIFGPWIFFSFFFLFFPFFSFFFCLFRVYGFWVSVLPFLFFPFYSPIYRFISLVSYGGLGFSVLPFSGLCISCFSL